MNTRLQLTLSLILISAIGAIPKPVVAASCHAGAGGQVICVLPAEQKYQFGLNTAYRRTLGTADPYGYYRPYSEDQSSHSLITQLGGAFRFHENWQAGITIPFFRNENSLGSKIRTAMEVGDPAIEARYSLWDDLYFMPLRPELSVYGGTRVPVGKNSFESDDTLETNAVGEGVFVPYFGLAASKLYRPWKIGFDSTFFYPFEKTVTQTRGQSIADPYRFKSGNRVQLVESINYLLNMKWGVGAGLKQFWQFESSVNGNSNKGSAIRAYTSFITTSYSYSSRLFFSGNFESAFPFYQYLANQPSNQTLSLMVGYNGF